jgi:hypothetical protein
MLSAVINHLWQSTFVAGGVGVLTLMVRRSSARVRFGLWFSASVKFLVPFALLGALGSHLPLRPPNFDANPGGVQVLSMAIERIVSPMAAPEPVTGWAPLIAASVHPWWVLVGCNS